MVMLVACLAMGLLGAGIVYVLTRSPELKTLQVSQFIFVPLGMMVSVYLQEVGGLVGFVAFLGILGIMAGLLAPNIAYYFGVGVTNLVDPQDWTPQEEELALKPINRLIDRENFRQALGELDGLLQTRKPTYEAVLVKAKLLHHLGRVDEARATLLALIPLSQSTDQRLAVMEMLLFLDQNYPAIDSAISAEEKTIETGYDLLLLPTADDSEKPHKEIPPGKYAVQRVAHQNRAWLKLKSQPWGIQEDCWEAARFVPTPPPEPAKNGILKRIAQLHQKVSKIFKGKLRRHVLSEAREFYAQASKLMRQEEWNAARPLLEKASALDPDRYEYAYRWALAVQKTADKATIHRTVNKILDQSQWTANEEQMLKQLLPRD